MISFKLLLLRILKRTHLIDRFNFSIKKELNGKIIKVPFINGAGLTNYVLKSDWMDLLIQSLVKEQDGCFVDVGVNIGQTLLRVKTNLPEIEYLGFEPNSTCVSYCQQLLRMNNFKNCTIQNCALSSQVQNLILEKSLMTDVRASVVSALRPGFFTEYEKVLALDYQSFYLDKQIAFVKIDVEGSEFEVLSGMRNAIEKHRPIIACEVLDSHNNDSLEFTQQKANQVVALINSMDYAIIRLITNKSNIISYERIETILIKQWTKESGELNDYLFFPKYKEANVTNTLDKIISPLRNAILG